jgi:hypothetical protein
MNRAYLSARLSVSGLQAYQQLGVSTRPGCINWFMRLKVLGCSRLLLSSYCLKKMIMKSLVLILGAGSSEEVGLPVGRDLKSQIAELLDIRFHHGGQQQSGDH